jgi:GGDEF domain-containing protein
VPQAQRNEPAAGLGYRFRMDAVAIGFWGAYFGSAALVFAGSLLLFVRSLRRAATIGLVAALVPTIYVLAFLGWLVPLEQDGYDRLVAHVTVVSGAALSIMLLTLLGRLRRRRSAQRAYAFLGVSAVATLAAGWASPPFVALAISCVYTVVVSAAMLLAAVRYAQQRHRMASSALLGVACIFVGAMCLESIALLRGAVPWPVHALAAVTGIVYMAIMAAALWLRVSYAMELREVIALGPTYDTITRMHAHTETGKVMGAFLRKARGDQSVGVVAVTVANLRVLESLHGRAAQNHALFVCASRLRSCAPMGAELCRVGEDGFLMLIRSPDDMLLLRQLARQIRVRLLRPIRLATGQGVEPGDEGNDWLPEIGVGIAVSDARMPPGNAVATARAISRTAAGYPSRMAYCDSATNDVAELAVETED